MNTDLQALQTSINCSPNRSCSCTWMDDLSKRRLGCSWIRSDHLIRRHTVEVRSIVSLLGNSCSSVVNFLHLSIVFGRVGIDVSHYVWYKWGRQNCFFVVLKMLFNHMARQVAKLDLSGKIPFSQKIEGVGLSHRPWAAQISDIRDSSYGVGRNGEDREGVVGLLCSWLSQMSWCGL